MRGCEYNHDNEVELFHKRHFMLVYVAKDENDPNIKEFQEAIKVLPKRMIYSLCHYQSEHINHYLHLFMIGGHQFQPGYAYVINVQATSKVRF